jgi:HAD superfamily hydrolase (TIGR01459 family)
MSIDQDAAAAASLADLPERYRVVLCDIWGCVHDGIRAYPRTVELLRAWQGQGRTVILLTNAPRPSVRVRRQLADLGVDEGCYSAVVSSGDAGVAYVRQNHAGEAVGAIGTHQDRQALEEAGVRLAPGAEGQTVICMGYEPHQADNAGAYDDVLAEMRERNAQMLCFNPDRVVVQGDKLALCAGTMADRYTELGGAVRYFGKPHRPIYDYALGVAADHSGRSVDVDEVVAIGDGVPTDLEGAAGYGLDFVFVSGGIEAEAFHEQGETAFMDAVRQRLGLSSFSPIMIVPQLR